MTAADEILQRRKAAVQKALPRLIQLDAELSAAKNKVKKIKDSRKALFGGLKNHGVSESAFLEAHRRAAKDQDDLNLFDSECMEIEEWLRVLIGGGKIVEDDSVADIVTTDSLDDEADKAEAGEVAADGDEDPGQEDLTEEEGDDEADGGPAGAAPTEPLAPAAPAADAAADDWMDPEPPHVAHARKQDELAEQQMAQRVVPIRGSRKQHKLPPADPNASKKIESIQADAGSEGISADDLPMPETELHRASQSGFVDHTERLSAEEARRELGLDDVATG